MPISSAVFESAGQRSEHFLPGAYSRLKSVQGNAGSVSASNGVLMGTCLGGKPNEIQWFSRYDDAAAALKGGDLLDAAVIAFNPGDNLAPSKVGFVRVNAATQSAAALKSGVTTIISLLTADYGVLTNQVQFKLTAGTSFGKKFMEYYKGQEFTYDNIRRQSLKIQYVGAGSAATITISATTLTTSVTGGPGGENLSITLADYADLASLAQYIDANAAYTCSVISGQETALSARMDVVTAGDIKTAEVTLESSVQAIIDTINTSIFWRASLSTNGRIIPDNVSTYTFATGGVEGTATSTEWTNALAALENEDVQLVGSVVESAAINALVRAHIVATNSVTGKRERQGITAVETQSLTAAKTEASVGNNYAVQVVYAMFQQYNASGVLTDFTSKMGVAQQMGQKIALALNNPTTHKAANVVKLNYTDCGTLTQIEDAIKNCVTVLFKDTAGTIRTARDISSYQADDLKLNENCMVRQMLYMSRDLRTDSERYVGLPGGGLLSLVELANVAKLNSYIAAGYLVGNPAWWDYKIIQDADKIRVVYTANVSAPGNFVFITNQFTVYISQ